LYFGRDDAESDITEGGLLREGFLRTAAYDAAVEGRKRLIIGRKGSGKSAICMTLASAGVAGYVTSLVTPDAMSLDEIRRFELQGVTDVIAKSLFWRYVLSLQVAKHLVSHAAAAHRRSVPAVGVLRKFLTANGQSIDPKLHEQFWRAIQRLKSLSLGAFGANLSVEVEAPSEGLKTFNQLEVVERHLLECLRALACPLDHDRLLLLVDQIEQVWSNDPQSDAMVTGLLLAAKHVSSRFSPVRCVVFLRSDIYDVLRFSEGDKFRGEEMRIDWTSVALQDLALARARASTCDPLTAMELWAELFPHEVDGIPMPEYLLSRTLMRPRDLIQFANACRDTAEKNGHGRVEQQDVLEAEVQFSQWKLQDLVREYEVNYPFLADLFTLFQNSGYIISRAALSARLDTRQSTLLRRFPQYTSNLTVDAVIDILYGIGFLGVERKKQIRYVYQDPARVEPDECRFYLHPGFRQALRSVTATDLHPYRSAMMIDRMSPVDFGRFGEVVGIRGGPDFGLLDSVGRAGERIMRRLQDPRLLPEAAQEIDSRIRAMIDDTLTVRRELVVGLGDVDLYGYVRWAVEFLSDLGRRLQASGVGDDDAVRTIARTMEDEARRLASEAGIRLSGP